MNSILGFPVKVIPGLPNNYFALVGKDEAVIWWDDKMYKVPLKPKTIPMPIFDPNKKEEDQ